MTVLPRQAQTLYNVEGACQTPSCVRDAVASVWVAGEPQETTKRLCDTHHQRLLAILASPAR